MNRLFICIEAVNGNNPGKKGLYPYVEAPDFSIKLIAYSVDGNPAQVVDVAHGGIIPQEVKAAIYDQNVTKTAFDGAFTRVCLSRFICRNRYEYLPSRSWECLRSKALYNGFPDDKEMLCRHLGMTENPAADMLGHVRKRIDVISSWKMEYLTARMWDLYKAALAAELENEISIALCLDRYPFPEFERKAYDICQRINDTGMNTDSTFIDKAKKRINAWNICALDRFERLTGRHNMRPDTFKDWLDENDLHVRSLSRESLLNLLPTGEPDTDEVITLWTELNRTNLSKYSRMAELASRDCRLRGQFRYFGSRTGRFGNESVQLDNLPVSILSDIDGLRKLTTDGSDTDVRSTGYSIPTLYTELLSTAITASNGRYLITLGYKNIEKKVAAWLTNGRNITELYTDANEALLEIMWREAETMTCGISWEMDENRLSVRLPSGRELIYRKPTYDDDCNLYFEGYDDRRAWRKLPLTGRRIINDIIQAISRDVLVDVLVRLNDSGHSVVMFYPGNVVIDGDSDEEFDCASYIFSEAPEWAPDLRFAWHGNRYAHYLEISRDSTRNC